MAARESDKPYAIVCLPLGPMAHRRANIDITITNSSSPDRPTDTLAAPPPLGRQSLHHSSVELLAVQRCMNMVESLAPPGPKGREVRRRVTHRLTHSRTTQRDRQRDKSHTKRESHDHSDHSQRSVWAVVEAKTNKLRARTTLTCCQASIARIAETFAPSQTKERGANVKKN